MNNQHYGFCVLVQSTIGNNFHIFHCLSPQQLIDLVPLTLNYQPSHYAQSYPQYVCNLHGELKHKISSTNEYYKLLTDVHCRPQEFKEEDMLCLAYAQGIDLRT